MRTGIKTVPILLFAYLIASASSVAHAQNPNPQTPNNAETICEEVKYGTPGLYGLCIAFWAGQDCEWDATDPFENCTPGSRKILEKYRARMQPGDPDMPGVGSDCPCWSEGVLAGLPYSDELVSCWWPEETPEGYGLAEFKWRSDIDPNPYGWFTVRWGIFAFWHPELETTCHLHSWCWDRPGCDEFTFEETHVVIEVSWEEYQACREDVIQTAIDWFPICDAFNP